MSRLLARGLKFSLTYTDNEEDEDVAPTGAWIEIVDFTRSLPPPLRCRAYWRVD